MLLNFHQQNRKKNNERILFQHNGIPDSASRINSNRIVPKTMKQIKLYPPNDEVFKTNPLNCVN